MHLKSTSVILFSFFISLFWLVACTAPEMGNAENDINALSDAFQEAWNKGDARLLASFYADDAVRVGAYGDVQHSKTEIEAAYNRILHTTMPGATLKQDPVTISMLSPEYAVRRGAFEVTPANDSLLIKGYVIEIYKKVNDQWLIIESHPKFFPAQ